MLNIALLITTCATSYLFYKIDAHNVIYHTINRKYRKWQKITKLVSSHNETILSIYTISIKMICQALYLSLLQYLNNSVTKIDKNTYEVKYVLGGKMYRMVVIPKKGPSHIIQIRDEYEEDITEHILPYYGPNYDWYSINFIPQFFNCKKMTFELDTGEEKIFEELEYIEI